MEKRRLYRKCSGFCGKVYPVRKPIDSYEAKGLISWITDPFAEEIHGDYTKMWLCDECAHEYAMDI